VFKAHRLLYHSTLGLGVIEKKRREQRMGRRGRSTQGYLAHKKPFSMRTRRCVTSASPLRLSFFPSIQFV